MDHIPRDVMMSSLPLQSQKLDLFCRSLCFMAKPAFGMIFLEDYSLPFSNTLYSWLKHSLSNSCHSRSSLGGRGEASSALGYHSTALEQDPSWWDPFWVLDITWTSAGCC